jgi:hypothetical protein
VSGLKQKIVREQGDLTVTPDTDWRSLVGDFALIREVLPDLRAATPVFDIVEMPVDTLVFVLCFLFRFRFLTHLWSSTSNSTGSAAPTSVGETAVTVVVVTTP